MEMSVDVRVWRYLAKKGLNILKDRFSELELDVGFVIEGRADSELPEQLLGCAHLIRLDLEKAVCV